MIKEVRIVAERRMFTKKITESDAFLDMPMSTQCLYFHLNMSADDDGFVNNPKRIQRLVGASDDDMKLLIAKSFIILFESGIIVIKHWKMHNYIQTDRYKPSDYIDEKSMLYLKKNKSYTLNNEEMDTECIQNVSVGKDRIDKDRLDKNNISSSLHSVVDAWNSLSEYGIKPISKLTSGTKRYDSLTARLKQYGLTDVLKAIDNIRHSDFLQGKIDSKRKWVITFDWFVLPNNFPKVLEGQYSNDDSKINDKPRSKSEQQIEEQLKDLENRQTDVLSIEEVERMIREGDGDG